MAPGLQFAHVCPKVLVCTQREAQYLEIRIRDKYCQTKPNKSIFKKGSSPGLKSST